jgi:hypothetical protein
VDGLSLSKGILIPPNVVNETWMPYVEAVANEEFIRESTDSFEMIFANYCRLNSVNLWSVNTQPQKFKTASIRSTESQETDFNIFKWLASRNWNAFQGSRVVRRPRAPSHEATTSSRATTPHAWSQSDRQSPSTMPRRPSYGTFVEDPLPPTTEQSASSFHWTMNNDDDDDDIGEDPTLVLPESPRDFSPTSRHTPTTPSSESRGFVRSPSFNQMVGAIID